MKFSATVLLFIILVGVDAEFVSYTYYGGLLKGSIVSIMTISALILAVNFAVVKAMLFILKGKW